MLLHPMFQCEKQAESRLLPTDVSQFRHKFPVLVIDDDVFFREMASAYLEYAGFTVQKAATVDEAEQLLDDPQYRLVLSDFLMPGRDGMDLCRQLREQERSYHYLLIMTSHTREDQMLAGLRSGADDFLSKSFSQPELVARLDCGVRVLLAQLLLEHQQKELLHQVQHDVLTGLYNRAFLYDVLPKAVHAANRYHYPLSLILCDIDHFKSVNDQHGHLNGDLVLKAVAKNIGDTLRDSDIAARFGGEEFLIALPHTTALQGMQVAEKIRLQLQNSPVSLPGVELTVTASFGVAQLLPDETLDQLLHRADLLMYQSKSLGRNRCSM